MSRKKKRGINPVIEAIQEMDVDALEPISITAQQDVRVDVQYTPPADCCGNCRIWLGTTAQGNCRLYPAPQMTNATHWCSHHQRGVVES